MSELITKSTISILKSLRNNAIMIVISMTVATWFVNIYIGKLDARLDRIEKLLETKKGANE